MNRCLKTFLFGVLLLLSLSGQALANGGYHMEDSVEAGCLWRLDENNVRYVHGGGVPFKLVENEGQLWLEFDEPGDAVVLAYCAGSREPYRVLLHVGEGSGGTAAGFSGQPGNPHVFAQRVLELVNVERRRHGLRPLAMAGDLADVAAQRAKEIERHFSHTRPNGRGFDSLLQYKGRCWGENIAAGSATPEAVVEQWMNSPGHRANILNGGFTELGVGYYYLEGSEYLHYWVQVFRGR